MDRHSLALPAAGFAVVVILAVGCGQTGSRPGTGVAPVAVNGGVSIAPVAFVKQASMSQARAGHAAAVLNGRIFVMGGDSNGAPTTSVESYDPATNSWSMVAPMTVARNFLSAAVSNGTLYAFGGQSNCNALPGSDVQGVEYRNAAGTWMSGPTMPMAMCQMAAAEYQGKIYVAGGMSNPVGPQGMLQIYDPVSHTWSIGPDLSQRFGSAGAMTATGNFLVMGGMDNLGISYNEVQSFDTYGSMWTMRTPMMQPRFALAAASDNNRIFALGGMNGHALDNVDVMDLGGSSQSLIWQPVKRMLVSRSHLAAVVLGNYLYAIGGMTDVGPTASMEALQIKF